MTFARLLKTWILLALGVLIAAGTASGIQYEDTGSLVVAVLLLSLLNVFLKPLLLLFSLPFIILTFGIGIWLINAVLFLLVGAWVPGFTVVGFWNALWGAFVVSLTGALANLLFGGGGSGGPGGGNGGGRFRFEVHRSGGPRREGRRKPLRDEDVIDI